MSVPPYYKVIASRLESAAKARSVAGRGLP